MESGNLLYPFIDKYVKDILNTPVPHLTQYGIIRIGKYLLTLLIVQSLTDAHQSVLLQYIGIELLQTGGGYKLKRVSNSTMGLVVCVVVCEDLSSDCRVHCNACRLEEGIKILVPKAHRAGKRGM